MNKMNKMNNRNKMTTRFFLLADIYVQGNKVLKYRNDLKLTTGKTLSNAFQENYLLTDEDLELVKKIDNVVIESYDGFKMFNMHRGRKQQVTTAVENLVSYV